MTPLNRILLLITGLLASYQLVIGIENFSTLPVIAYTVGFGVLLIAGLLLMIFGFDVLNSPVVVIVSTLIPVTLSLGLVWQHLPYIRVPYLVFTLIGFLLVIATRAFSVQNILPTLILALVHGISGITIFLLPILLSVSGKVEPGFALVGVGGALIGIGGLLLSFLKTGKPVLTSEAIYTVLPGLLMLMAACFVVGFSFSSS